MSLLNAWTMHMLPARGTAEKCAGDQEVSLYSRRGRLLVGLASAVLVLAKPLAAESLADAVRAALTENPAVKARSSEARAAAFELLQLRGEYLPTVSVFGDLREERVDNPSQLSVTDNDTSKTASQARLEAELLLFDGASRENRVFAGAARVDSAIFSLLDASETLALTAVEAYVDVLRRRALRSVAQENIDRHRDLAAQVQAAVDGGRLPASDGFEARNRLLASELAAVRVDEALALANARYLRVIGRDASGPMSVPAPSQVVSSVQELVRTSVESSFRLKAAESDIQQRGYEKGIIEGERRPRFSVNAGVAAGENRNGSSGPEDSSYLGLQLEWTLYKGGRRPESEALIERRERAIQERHFAAREVREMAERAWATYRTDLARRALLDDQVVANEAIVVRYREEFEAGTRSLLDLLDAERSLFNVRFQKVSTDWTVRFNPYRLLAAQSRLAQTFGVRPAGITLEPEFEDRARARPLDIFQIEVPSLQ